MDSRGRPCSPVSALGKDWNQDLLGPFVPMFCPFIQVLCLHFSWGVAFIPVFLPSFHIYVLSFKETVQAELASHSQHQIGLAGRSSPDSASYVHVVQMWLLGVHMYVRGGQHPRRWSGIPLMIMQ